MKRSARRVIAPAFAISLALSILAACGGQGDTPGAAPGATPEPASRPFTDITAAAGVTFVHENAATERRYLPETMGAGVAVFDYDGDSWPDLYFVNGAPATGVTATGAPTGALYRNRGDGTFVDTTRDAGLAVAFLGMGTAVGDLDNDGDVDLFVTGVGGDRLFRNDGGRFVEVTESYGLVDRGFGSSAAFLDVDRDGWLDLYAGRYVKWSQELDRRCSPDGKHPSYCTPEAYEGASNRLYRNTLGTRFEDVTRTSGVLDASSKTLGIVPLDYDDDGWPDLAVANDTTRNLLFHNRGDGRFAEVGVEEGIAYSPSGSTRGGMGIDAADTDGDGRAEVVVGNFAQEMTGLYHADPGGPYSDDAASLGVGLETLMTLAFGTMFLDYDGDGWLDLLVVNGHIEPSIALFQPHQSHAQAPALFRNLGGSAGFALVGDPGDLAAPIVGRGLAAGDLDRDGDLDLVITQNGARARILRNDAPRHSWLRLELRSGAGSVTPYGARVTVTLGDRAIQRTLVSGRSYLSASEPQILIGLGDARRVDRVSIRWPSGAEEERLDVPVNQVVQWIEGAAAAPGS